MGFPYVNVMPSGGVSLENINKWFKNGAYVVVGGDEIVIRISLYL